MAIDNSKYGITREDIEKAALGDFEDFELPVNTQPESLNVAVQSVDTNICPSYSQGIVYNNSKDVYSDSDKACDDAFIFCTECGNSLPSDAKFCTSCGTPVVAFQDDIQCSSEPVYSDVQLQENQLNFEPQNVDNQIFDDYVENNDAQYDGNSVLFCTSCGAQLEAEMRFCTSCGTPITEGSDNEQYIDNHSVGSHTSNDDEPTILPEIETSVQLHQPTGAGDSFVFCTKCGTQLPSDMRFCTSCGTPVAELTVGGNSFVQPQQKQSFLSKFNKK